MKGSNIENNGNGEGRPSTQSIMRRIVIINQPSHIHQPILDNTVETAVDEEILTEITAVTLGGCEVCGRSIHNEDEVGGVCYQCGGVLCNECTSRRCAKCGHCLCTKPACAVEIFGTIYCRSDASQTIISWILAITAIFIFFSGIVWLIWQLTS